MTPQELEIYAVERKYTRLQLIEPVYAQLPKRKSKGDEVLLLVSTVDATHELLCQYDLMPEPPAIAGVLGSSLEPLLARIEDVLASRKKKMPPRPGANT